MQISFLSILFSSEERITLRHTLYLQEIVCFTNFPKDKSLKEYYSLFYIAHDPFFT